MGLKCLIYCSILDPQNNFSWFSLNLFPEEKKFSKSWKWTLAPERGFCFQDVSLMPDSANLGGQFNVDIFLRKSTEATKHICSMS